MVVGLVPDDEMGLADFYIRKAFSAVALICSHYKMQARDHIALGIRFAMLNKEKELLERQMQAIQGTVNIS